MAGEPEFDIAFWREHTEYKGYRPEDATVDLFWKVKYRRCPGDARYAIYFLSTTLGSTGMICPPVVSSFKVTDGVPR